MSSFGVVSFCVLLGVAMYVLLFWHVCVVLLGFVVVCVDLVFMLCRCMLCWCGAFGVDCYVLLCVLVCVCCAVCFIRAWLDWIGLLFVMLR